MGGLTPEAAGNLLAVVDSESIGAPFLLRATSDADAGAGSRHRPEEEAQEEALARVDEGQAGRDPRIDARGRGQPAEGAAEGDRAELDRAARSGCHQRAAAVARARRGVDLEAAGLPAPRPQGADHALGREQVARIRL